MKKFLFTSFIVLTNANADVYKCINAEGKKVYSQTKCAGDSTSMEKIKTNPKQPVITESERIMRLKNDAYMDKLYAEQEKEDQELYEAREARIESIEAEQRAIINEQNRRIAEEEYWNKVNNIIHGKKHTYTENGRKHTVYH